MDTRHNSTLTAVAILSAAGVLFAGYLSWTSLFATSCAFGETCQYLFGYPTCVYGFVMYLVLFIAALLGALGKLSARRAFTTTTLVSAAGILFAGYFVIEEITASAILGPLGLSTCAYGLIFYILVFILSLRGLRATQA